MDTAVRSAERKALEAALAAGFLDRDSKSWKLLHYLCGRHFEGADDELKEYNIAVDVFGRTAEFDKRRDSIVRVEISRLRKRLEEYYTREGREQPLRIVIPAGRYAPRFVPQAPAAGDFARPAPERWRDRLWMFLALALALTALALMYRPWTRPAATGAARGPADTGQPVGAALAGLGSGTGEVRILCGYWKEQYIDRQGKTWRRDHDFVGGEPVSLPTGFIARTLDDTFYGTMRTGNFSYRIPLKRGVYELWLYFAELVFGPGTQQGGGETSRLMQIAANDKVLLDEFDVYADAGGDHIADVRVFKDITPDANGFLNLKVNQRVGLAFVNAIELRPGVRGRISPVRIVARDTFYTDHLGRVWTPDSYVRGGRLQAREEPVAGSSDGDLYQGERFGRFDYAIPVAAGRYAVTLHFSEHYFRDGPGRRRFNVFSNGTALLRNFDIFHEAGGPLRSFVRTFHGIEPNAQGKIVLDFVPVTNYASVNAIEITDESR